MDSHNHPHEPLTLSGQKRLWLALWINLVFLIIELVGGLITNSLALLADAGHMLSDVAALLLALIAAKIAERPSSAEKTFGYLRAEVLGAFVNAMTLVLISLFIVIESIKRFAHPPEVEAKLMIIIATAGFIANIASAVVLAKGRHDSMNIKGAFLHMFADALGSLGAIIGGLMIYYFHWNLIDPIVGTIIVILILYSSWGLLRDTTNVLLEGAPGHLNYKEIKKALEEMDEIKEAYHIHIWTISTGVHLLTAHIRLKENYSHKTWHSCLSKSSDMLCKRFQIYHSTLQIEPGDFQSDPNACYGPDEY